MSFFPANVGCICPVGTILDIGQENIGGTCISENECTNRWWCKGDFVSEGVTFCSKYVITKNIKECLKIDNCAR